MAVASLSKAASSVISDNLRMVQLMTLVIFPGIVANIKLLLGHNSEILRLFLSIATQLGDSSLRRTQRMSLRGERLPIGTDVFQFYAGTSIRRTPSASQPSCWLRSAKP